MIALHNDCNKFGIENRNITSLAVVDPPFSRFHRAHIRFRKVAPISGKKLKDASFPKDFSNYEKNYASRKRITRYIEFLKKLWGKVFGRLKTELRRDLVSIQCLEWWSFGKFLQLAKASRTADKDTHYKLCGPVVLQKTKLKDQPQQKWASMALMLQRFFLVSSFYNALASHS